MSLHRHHQTGPRRTGTRLALKDQLLLQDVVRDGVRMYGDYEFEFDGRAHRVVLVLQRHGVDVSLDEHTGRVTFNPEVVEA